MRVRHASLVLAIGLVVAASVSSPLAAGAAGAVNTNGISGSMPAFYDHQLFTINFFQLTVAQPVLLDKNSQQNIIYQSDPGLPGGAPFISVINAIQADGFNPLWAEVQIAFTAGHTPRQLFSDDEIAAAAASGEITLTPTNEMYRCSVIGAPARVTSGGVTRSSLTGGAVSRANLAPASSLFGPSSLSWGATKIMFR
jgi:hypothetical protein